MNQVLDRTDGPSAERSGGPGATAVPPHLAGGLPLRSGEGLIRHRAGSGSRHRNPPLFSSRPLARHMNKPESPTLRFASQIWQSSVVSATFLAITSRDC